MTLENTYLAVANGRIGSRCRTCMTNSGPRSDAQRKAYDLIEDRVRNGRLVPGPCVDCGAEKVHAHHPNGYEGEASLDIVWLCPKHHQAAHKAAKESAA